MDFKIKFKLPKPGNQHIRNLTNTIGMDFINTIHNDIGVPVPAKQMNIYNSCPSFNNSTKHIYVNECYLQDIPHFNARPDIDVFIPDGFLGQFWEMEIKNTGYKNELGFIREIIYSTLDFFKIKTKRMKLDSTFNISFDLNEIALIETWIDAGCPLYWNTSIEDIEEHPNENKEYLLIQTQRYNNRNTPFSEYSLWDSKTIADNIKDVVLYEDIFQEKNDDDDDYGSKDYNKICAILQKSQIQGIFKVICENVDLKTIEQFEDIIEDVCLHKREKG